jgi:hypothetical protein
MRPLKQTFFFPPRVGVFKSGQEGLLRLASTIDGKRVEDC